MSLEVDQAVILVVDDNEMNRDMLSRRLKRQQYHVEVADNGEDAIQMMQAADFDLVLLDIMMPRLNGYEVLERVKADARLQEVPIIMISAVDDLDSVVRCIELGAEDYLFKPFNPVLLKARVSASLERRRQRRQREQGAATELAPILSAMMEGMQHLAAGHAGPLNEAQTRVIEDLIENTKELSHFLSR